MLLSGTLGEHDKQELFRQVRKFMPGVRFPNSLEGCHNMWLESSLPNLRAAMRGEKESIKAQARYDPAILGMLKGREQWVGIRTWDMIVQSSIKQVAVEEIVAQVFGEFAQVHRGQPFVQTISIVALGSVARMEAEIISDVDIDIFFDSPENKAMGYKQVIHDELHAEMSRRAQELLGTKKINAQINDARIYTTLEIEDELSTGDYDHVSKLLLEGKPLLNRQIFTKRYSRWKQRATKEGIIAERRTWIARRFNETAKDLQRGGLFPNSSRFHMLVSFYVQVLALHYLGLKVAQLPYWLAADKLIQYYFDRGNREIGELLGRCVVRTLKVRQATVMPTDDITNLLECLQNLQQLTGISLIDLATLPVQLQPRLMRNHLGNDYSWDLRKKNPMDCENANQI
jgi:predicted nucleotidyltransferase